MRCYNGLETSAELGKERQMATKTRTTNPTRTAPTIDPERHYNPERLCPTQRDDAEKSSRP